MSISKAVSISEMIERHRTLDHALVNRRYPFLSDWNCNHPFLEEFLGPELAGITPEFSAGDYIYLDERPALTQAVIDFHKSRESLCINPINVLTGAGSSALLTAFAFLLAQQSIKCVYYFPPLYHSLHLLFRLLNIETIRVSEKQAFEPDFNMSLPDNQSMLVFCDPIWYAGRRVPAQVISQISSWQERTGSLVFVDGSFQNLIWDTDAAEATASLNSEQTFRLVSPTKALALHSFRFSYLLHPSAFHDSLTFLYESVAGSVTVGNLMFGHRALEVLSSERRNRCLAQFLRETFAELVDGGFLRTEITPDCGYFVFAIPAGRMTQQVAMNQDYFELTGYPEHVRVNLMVARRVYLES